MVILYIMSCVQQEHKTIRNARVAQLVERDLAKVEAAGSSPVSRSFCLNKQNFFPSYYNQNTKKKRTLSSID